MRGYRDRGYPEDRPGYVGSLPRLTLVLPGIVEAILDGRQPVGVGLPVLLTPFRVERDR